jgi:DNA-3-methyladenine glycosylase
MNRVRGVSAPLPDVVIPAKAGIQASSIVWVDPIPMLQTPQPLARNFYARPTRTVARELLGCRLVRQLNGIRLSGVIVEAEAYIGESDLACHAKAGKTSRTAVMYGHAGIAYVYFTYGMHWMLNVVTEEKDFPAAVLLRAIEPLEGIEEMRRLRGGKDLSLLGKGPACLTQALGITRAENGLDLCAHESGLWIEPGQAIPKRKVALTPRIGLGKTPEPWLSKPWRYTMAGSPFVSR